MSKRVSNKKRGGGARATKGARRRRAKVRLTTERMEFQSNQLWAQNQSLKMMQEVKDEQAHINRKISTKVRKAWRKLTRKLK